MCAVEFFCNRTLSYRFQHKFENMLFHFTLKCWGVVSFVEFCQDMYCIINWHLYSYGLGNLYLMLLHSHYVGILDTILTLLICSFSSSCLKFGLKHKLTDVGWSHPHPSEKQIHMTKLFTIWQDTNPLSWDTQDKNSKDIGGQSWGGLPECMQGKFVQNLLSLSPALTHAPSCFLFIKMKNYENFHWGFKGK